MAEYANLAHFDCEVVIPGTIKKHKGMPGTFLLAHGLYIDGERVPLVSQQGIWPTPTPDPDRPRERRPGRWSAGFEAA